MTGKESTVKIKVPKSTPGSDGLQMAHRPHFFRLTFTYSLADTGMGALHSPSYLLLTTTLQSEYYYSPFIGEKTQRVIVTHRRPFFQKQSWDLNPGPFIFSSKCTLHCTIALKMKSKLRAQPNSGKLIGATR